METYILSTQIYVLVDHFKRIVIKCNYDENFNIYNLNKKMLNCNKH